MVHRVTLLFAAAALLGSVLPAQLQKGALPPEIPFLKVWNDGPANFADFAGKIVILKFSETW